MLDELVLSSRTIRYFDESRPVSREDLLKIIDTARLTPCARNLQSLKYKLICDKEGAALMTSLSKWGGATPELGFPVEGHYATAFIVICCDREIASEYGKWINLDAGIATQTIMLKAAEMGYGGCILGSFVPEKVAEALELGERYYPVIVLALGTPAEKARIVSLPENGSINYYRDEENINCVPKRSLEELII